MKLPIGVYKRTKYHRLKISEAATKQWDKKNKGERLKRMLPAIKANRKYWDNMTDVERIKCTESWRIAGTRASCTLKARQKVSYTRKKWFAKMSKEEKLKRLVFWIKAGQKASHKKFIEMSKEERFKFMLPKIIASQKANPSSIEKSIWRELDKLNICYETQVPFNHSKFIVDIYVPIWKLIIECNGDYYHNYKMFPQSRVRDKALERYAYRNGLKIIWLWEHNIRKDPKQALLSKLKLNNIIL